MFYIIGQILGVVIVILGFINYLVKTRERVLIIHIATTLCFAFHYMFLGAWAGMAMNFVGFARNIVFYKLGKNGKLKKRWPILFATITCIMGTTASLVAGEGWYFVLSVAGITGNSYAMSFANPNNIRKSILITSPLVLIYDVLSASYGGMVYEFVIIISSIIGLIREAINKNKLLDNKV